MKCPRCQHRRDVVGRDDVPDDLPDMETAPIDTRAGDDEMETYYHCPDCHWTHRESDGDGIPDGSCLRLSFDEHYVRWIRSLTGGYGVVRVLNPDEPGSPDTEQFIGETRFRELLAAADEAEKRSMDSYPDYLH